MVACGAWGEAWCGEACGSGVSGEKGVKVNGAWAGSGAEAGGGGPSRLTNSMYWEPGSYRRALSHSVWSCGWEIERDGIVNKIICIVSKVVNREMGRDGRILPSIKRSVDKLIYSLMDAWVNSQTNTMQTVNIPDLLTDWLAGWLNEMIRSVYLQIRLSD